jgi:hypothetical protein
LGFHQQQKKNEQLHNTGKVFNCFGWDCTYQNFTISRTSWKSYVLVLTDLHQPSSEIAAEMLLSYSFLTSEYKPNGNKTGTLLNLQKGGLLT